MFCQLVAAVVGRALELDSENNNVAMHLKVVSLLLLLVMMRIHFLWGALEEAVAVVCCCWSILSVRLRRSLVRMEILRGPGPLEA